MNIEIAAGEDLDRFVVEYGLAPRGYGEADDALRVRILKAREELLAPVKFTIPEHLRGKTRLYINDIDQGILSADIVSVEINAVAGGGSGGGASGGGKSVRQPGAREKKG